MSDYFTSETTLRYRAPELPPDLSAWPELAEAADTHRRLEREHSEAAAAYSAASAALQESIASDRAALAKARLAGAKKLPGSESVQKAEAAVRETKRQLDAADDARRQGVLLVIESVEKNRAAWVAMAQELAEKACADEAAALTAYLETVDASTHARETAAWFEGFPEPKRQYRPHPGRVHAGRGEPVPFAEIADGLRIRAGLAPPPARTLREHVEAKGLTPAAVIGGPSEGEAA